MMLTDSDGNSVTTKTDANGYYQFYNLAAGTYTVALVSNPSGYSVVGDIDGAPLGKITATAIANQGTKEQNMWFISVSEKGVTGKVTYSPTQSATASATDVPVSGLTVELYDAANPTGAALYTATTGTDGTYSFPGIPTMNYIIKVKDTDKTAGGYIDLNPATGQIAVTVPTAGVENQNFILGGIHSLSGKIGIDSDGDDAIDVNLSGIHTKVTWYGSDGVLGTADDVIFSSDTTISGAAQRTTGQTIATGGYSYATLPNGNYKIEALDSTLTTTGVSLITTIAGNTNPKTQDNVTTDQTDINFIYGYVGAISGTVVIDIDANKEFTTGVDQTWTASTLTIRLEDSSNPANFKTLTTTDGTFNFTGIDPTKTWKVSVSNGMTTGYSFSFGLGDTNNATAANAYATVALTATTPSKTGVVLGYKGSGTISGKVVMDNILTDGGKATSADTSLGKDIEITISGGAGFIPWIVKTDTNGNYTIENLAPYTYTVSINQSQSVFGGLVISFDPEHGTTSPTGSAEITVPTAMSNQIEKDFGYKGRGSISGKVLIDVEGTGTYTAADKAFGSAIIVTANNGSITRTTTANATTGEYSFDTIPTGIWEVYVDTIPASYSFSYGVGKPTYAVELNGTRVKVDINSALVGRATSPTLNAVEVYLGYKGSAKISGKLVYDNNPTDGADIVDGIDSPLGNHKITLTGAIGFAPVDIMMTATGEYSFENLGVYGSYKVVVTTPTGYTYSFDPDSTEIAPTPPTGNGEMSYNITSPTMEEVNQNFGFKGTGKISGKIYQDLNDNGIYNSGTDIALGNVTVTLTNGAVTRTVTTGADGTYEVTGISAGDWTVITSDVDPALLASFDRDDAHDVTGQPQTPNQAIINVATASAEITDADFGYIQRGKLIGVVKEDQVASELYDPNDPGIEGVTVHLVKPDGTTPILDAAGAPIILTTDATGHFVVRNLDCPTTGAEYSVRVEFGPSTTGPLSGMEPSYDSDTLGSGCGSGVNLNTGIHIVKADITDTLTERIPENLYLGYRSAVGDIKITKKAAKSTAKIGDIVPYTITIENLKEVVALDITIEDLIPAGFKYVDGSARLDGEKIPNPEGNRPLKFKNIDLEKAGADGSVRKLSYFLVVGSGVTQGEYTNIAVAKDRFNKTASNTSQATVEITSDPLFDDSLIFGKVYIDANGNGEQDAEEEGLGGIKLATGRGEIITTDEHGRYHIPTVDGGRWERGRNFILKLDVRSLPAGYKVISDNPIVVRTSPGLPNKINFRVKEVEVKDQETKKE